MKHSVSSTLLILLAGAALAQAVEMPWQVNTPIVSVQKTLYVAHPGAGQAPWIDMSYVGPNLELLETRGILTSSGDLSNQQWRLSNDNGKNWSAFAAMPASTVYYNGVRTQEWYMARYYDTTSGSLVETWQRNLPSAQNGYGFGSQTSYWATSGDHGATWSTPQMLRYEAGPEFDPANPLASGYINNNQSWCGNNIIKLASGNLLTTVGEARPLGHGSMCFIGTWNPTASNYQWTAGNPVSIAADKSGYLTESEVAELSDHRVLVTWRGTNTSTTPGRKWFSVSTDGGMTLSAPAELKYDDGSEFYSPASFQRMVRSSQTGKLYWIGNITADPPSGATPRYPLVIAEVDESNATPALKKDTVTVIDDRQPGQPAGIQFSNFTVFEDRETHAFDLYMTLVGEDASNVFSADNYKYIVTLADPVPEPSSLVLLGAATAFLTAWTMVRRGGK